MFRDNRGLSPFIYVTHFLEVLRERLKTVTLEGNVLMKLYNIVFLVILAFETIIDRLSDIDAIKHFFVRLY